MILTHNFSDLLETLCRGDDLTESEAGALFEAVFAGEVDAVRLGAILAALKAKGESSAEIRGAAKAMLAAAAAFPRPADLEIGEIVGTGGDGARTINISTTAALAAAGTFRCQTRQPGGFIVVGGFGCSDGVGGRGCRHARTGGADAR